MASPFRDKVHEKEVKENLEWHIAHSYERDWQAHYLVDEAEFNLYGIAGVYEHNGLEYMGGCEYGAELRLMNSFITRKSHEKQDDERWFKTLYVKRYDYYELIDNTIYKVFNGEKIKMRVISQSELYDLLFLK